MPSSQAQDPLQYLNPLERVIFGKLVRRIFTVNGRRVAYSLQNYGPRAAARLACCSAATQYGLAIGILAIVVQVAQFSAAAVVLYIVAGIFVGWSFVCILSSRKPRRDFERANGLRD